MMTVIQTKGTGMDVLSVHPSFLPCKTEGNLLFFYNFVKECT
jgi:hypothetical protein